jgi:hypothetical protein
MYQVSFCNSGGPLDEPRAAATPEEAAQAAIEMIQSVGMLYRGDTITIASDNEDDE